MLLVQIINQINHASKKSNPQNHLPSSRALHTKVPRQTGRCQELEAFLGCCAVPARSGVQFSCSTASGRRRGCRIRLGHGHHHLTHICTTSSLHHSITPSALPLLANRNPCFPVFPLEKAVNHGCHPALVLLGTTCKSQVGSIRPSLIIPHVCKSNPCPIVPLSVCPAVRDAQREGCDERD